MLRCAQPGVSRAVGTLRRGRASESIDHPGPSHHCLYRRSTGFAAPIHQRLPPGPFACEHSHVTDAAPRAQLIKSMAPHKFENTSSTSLNPRIPAGNPRGVKYTAIMSPPRSGAESRLRDECPRDPHPRPAMPRVLWGSDSRVGKCQGVPESSQNSLCLHPRIGEDAPPRRPGGAWPGPAPASRLDCAGLASQQPLWMVLPESLLCARHGPRRQGGMGQVAGLSPKDTGQGQRSRGRGASRGVSMEGLQVRGRPEGRAGGGGASAEGVEGSTARGAGAGVRAVAGPVWGWRLGWTRVPTRKTGAGGRGAGP